MLNSHCISVYHHHHSSHVMAAAAAFIAPVTHVGRLQLLSYIL